MLHGPIPILKEADTMPTNDRRRGTSDVACFSGAALAVAVLTAVLAGCGTTKPAAAANPPASQDAPALVADGQKVFRFATFGDEQVWTDKLRLNRVVEKSVDPTTALMVGLKVDADVLPAGILEKVDLKSPATTVALLKMNAVVGLQATVDSNNHITRLGVTWPM